MPKTPQFPPATPLPPPPRVLLSVRDFAERHSAFPVATLRDLIFKAEERYTANGKLPGNGLLEAGAIVRVGRKVMLDEARFFAWVDSIQNQPQKSASAGRMSGIDARLAGRRPIRASRHVEATP